MANENVSINIDSKADLKGFKQAESAASKLNKTVKGLAATLGIAYGARAVTNFGKAAVKAFTEDQKSAVKLATAVKNLGLSFEQANVEGFISNLEKSASIADDLLRPALQTLLTTTGDFAKSQDLLKTAINVSRGSGEELITVANDLAQAYVGNTKGLKKYYLGLSQAQLKGMSFLKLQEKLDNQFKGASKAYLETYAGKMEALSTAAGRAQETIGGALVDALINVSGAGDIQGLIDKIDGVAAAGVKAISTMDVLAQSLYFAATQTTPLEFFGFDFGKGADRFAKIIEEQRKAAQYAGAAPYNPKDNALTGYKASEAAAKKAQETAAKNAKALAAAQAKQTAELKKQAAIKKASKVFDLDQIQLLAALKGKLSEDDKKRVEAQMALLNENDALATQLTKDILMAQDATGGLYKYFQTIPNAKNPFGYLDQWIIDFQNKMNSLNFPVPVVESNLGGNTSWNGNAYIPPGFGFPEDMNVATNASLADGTPFGQAGSSAAAALGTPFGQAGSNSVVINVAGSVVTQQELVNQVSAGLQTSSLSGSPSQIGRNQGMFGL